MSTWAKRSFAVVLAAFVILLPNILVFASQEGSGGQDAGPADSRGGNGGNGQRASLARVVWEGVTASGDTIELTPDQPFRPDELGYTMGVPNEVTAVKAIPYLGDDVPSSLIVNGVPLANGQASKLFPLPAGGTFEVGISAVPSDPAEARTYTFNLYRAKAGQHFLKRLSMTPGMWDNDFVRTAAAYSSTVAFDVYQVEVTAPPLYPSDTATVDGIPSRGGPVPVHLAEGSNTIMVKVAGAGSTGSTDYTIHVYRNTHDELKSLQADEGTAVREFVPQVHQLELDVPNATVQIHLTPTAFAAGADIEIDGQTVASGHPSQPLPLAEGENHFPVMVNGSVTYDVSVYREPASEALTMSESGDTVTIRSGSISATFEKTKDRLIELHKPLERDVIGKGMGYFFLNPNYKDEATGRTHVINWSPGTGDAEFHVAEQSPDKIDVYFTFDNVPADKMGPFRWEQHFVFLKHQSGFYTYIIARMPQSYSTPGKTDWSVGQVRWSIRGDAHLFTYVQNEGGPAVKLPAPNQVTRRYKIMDATYRQSDNSGYTKYDMVNSEAYTHFYGLLGKRYGLWFIKAGNDYTNGLPFAQEIGAHQTDTTPIVNWAPNAAHYGRRTGIQPPGWSHIWGPIRVELNEAGSMDALYQGVSKTAQQEIAQWPYRWLTDPLYAVKDRGTVKGKITIEGEGSPKNVTVVLAAPGEDPQFQAGGYVYYTRADRSGQFVLHHVRAGAYALYVYADGIFGSMEKDGIAVAAARTLDVGNLLWDARSKGKKLWQIGIPDRSAAEYLHGNEYRQWGLWLRYPFDFPNGVDYNADTDDYHTDWNYAQPLNKTPGQIANLLVPFSNDPAVWKIRFKAGRVPHGVHGLLTAAIASERSGAFRVALNGTQIEDYTFPYSDSAFPRSGIRGIYTLLRIPFDASLLKEGENVLTLTPSRKLFDPSGKRITDYYSAILYDSLKMELVPGAKGK